MKSSRFGNYFQKRRPRITVDLGCQKMMEGSVFRGLDRSQNLLSDLDLGGPGDLRSDLRGHPRPKMAKIIIYPAWRMITSSYFKALTWGRSRSRPQSDFWDPSRPRPNIRPPWSFEAATSNTTSEAVRGRNLKSTCKISIEGDLRGLLRPRMATVFKITEKSVYVPPITILSTLCLLLFLRRLLQFRIHLLLQLQ